MADVRRVLLFGDSLTWGWVPVETVVPTTRYPAAERWPGVAGRALGEGFELVVEALSGRTTTADDPLDPRLNGAAYLPAALASHLPLDLVVVLLGTNDTKAYFAREPFDVAVGVARLLGIVAASAGGVGTTYPAPAALLVAPPPLGEITEPWHREVFRGGQEKSRAFAPLYEAVALRAGASFLDAGTLITTDGVDGIHWTPENNRVVGEAVAERIRALLG